MAKLFSTILIWISAVFLVQVFPNLTGMVYSVPETIGLTSLGIAFAFLASLLDKRVPENTPFNISQGLLIFAFFCFAVNAESESHNHFGWVLLIGFAAAVTLPAIIVKPCSRFSGVSHIKMSGYDFEYYCADILRKRGFHHVQVTPGSNDYGADIVAYDKKNNRWVFQCKYYSGKVSNDAVQEVVTAKAHYGAARGAVMTNSKLTENARKLALENDIELLEMLN